MSIRSLSAALPPRLQCPQGQRQASHQAGQVQYRGGQEKVRGIFKAGISLPQDVLIRRLNPVIRGWGNCYRHVVSKEVFDGIDHAIWRMTWNWAKRRHPQKGRKWVNERYYAHRDRRDWMFTDGSVTHFPMATIPIRRHVKVRGDANPYDLQDAGYFVERHARRGHRPPLLLRHGSLCDASPATPTR